jgi:hypothetical protein
MKNKAINSIVTNAITLFAIGDSTSPKEVTFIWPKSKMKPNVRQTAATKKEVIAIGIVFPCTVISDATSKVFFFFPITDTPPIQIG